MKKVFVSYSFSKREDVRKLHKKLKELLETRFNLEVYAFVFDFTEELSEKRLMEAALSKIDESDLVMVELSNKSVGVGIEAGYARARGKPIVYLHKKGAKLEQTMNGISGAVITYEDVEGLIKQMSSLKLLQG